MVTGHLNSTIGALIDVMLSCTVGIDSWEMLETGCLTTARMAMVHMHINVAPTTKAG